MTRFDLLQCNYTITTPHLFEEIQRAALTELQDIIDREQYTVFAVPQPSQSTISIGKGLRVAMERDGDQVSWSIYAGRLPR